MSNLPNQAPKFFDSDSMSGAGLGQYIQSLHPEAIAQLSEPSFEAAKVIESNIIGMLGTLPPEAFDVTITTSREYLGQLLLKKSPDWEPGNCPNRPLSRTNN